MFSDDYNYDSVDNITDSMAGMILNRVINTVKYVVKKLSLVTNVLSVKNLDTILKTVFERRKRKAKSLKSIKLILLL